MSVVQISAWHPWRASEKNSGDFRRMDEQMIEKMCIYFYVFVSVMVWVCVWHIYVLIVKQLFTMNDNIPPHTTLFHLLSLLDVYFRRILAGPEHKLRQAWDASLPACLRCVCSRQLGSNIHEIKMMNFYLVRYSRDWLRSSRVCMRYIRVRLLMRSIRVCMT